MLKFCPQRIIRDARHATTSATFSFAEIIFVTRCEQLTDDEKLVWLMLSALSADHAFLRCSITYSHLANLVNKSADMVRLSILRLAHLGFIHVEETVEDLVFLQISLPPEGLLQLKKAKRVVEEGMVMHVNGRYRRPEEVRRLLKAN